MRRQIEELPESLGCGAIFFDPFSAMAIEIPDVMTLWNRTDLCDRRTMLVDSPNNVGTPRASSAS